jgi:hypothetical protein
MPHSMSELPDFLIIGAQKCGTTWLHRHLSVHPDIFMPRDKDLDFHCYVGSDETGRRAAYRRRFSVRNRADALVGDASAAYFWTPTGSRWDLKPHGFETRIPQRVREHLGPDLKLILTLRSPVERAISAYFHHLGTGRIRAGTPLIEAGAEAGILDMGFYAAHLENWLAAYPFEAFEIVELERDIRSRPLATLSRLFSFLGVDASHEPILPEKAVFEGSPRYWKDGELWIRLEQGAEEKVLDTGAIRDLYALYAADVRELSAITGTAFDRLWGFGQQMTVR